MLSELKLSSKSQTFCLDFMRRTSVCKKLFKFRLSSENFGWFLDRIGWAVFGTFQNRPNENDVRCFPIHFCFKGLGQLRLRGYHNLSFNLLFLFLPDFFPCLRMKSVEFQNDLQKGTVVWKVFRIFDFRWFLSQICYNLANTCQKVLNFISFCLCNLDLSFPLRFTSVRSVIIAKLQEQGRKWRTNDFQAFKWLTTFKSDRAHYGNYFRRY